MGCLCSKESSPNDYANGDDEDKELKKSAVLVVAPSNVVKANNNNGSVRNSVLQSQPTGVQTETGPVHSSKDDEEKKTRIVERPKDGYKRKATLDFKANGSQQHASPMVSLPGGTEAEQISAGWPPWLTSVAGEAIQGWLPRSAESYEKLKKIGQGTYSSVYKARDLKTNKTVAMKKVRFVNMDPESVRFMAREIHILRKLDHPNVMKLEAIVTSRISGSLYLVFEYMEHDLAGLAASPRINKFTEPQIKCYMKQLLLGLEHCHNRGILHRDIKGSNLLVDNNGVLKIGDFGLANFFEPEQKHPLTSRVVTLWYRAPELLLGATEYGVAIDMWSAGCILAELVAGKPIMPGRTEVEQMHKIFKLCGSPSEEYWRKSKLPHATSFKPQQRYRRYVTETFKDFPPSALALIDVLLSMEPDKRGTATTALNSEFFTTSPLPCDPSSLPKYPPSKEFDAKLRDEEAQRRKAEGRVPESKRVNGESKGVPTPELDAKGQEQSNKSISVKYVPREDGGAGFPIEPPRVFVKNGYVHSNSVIHPSAVGYARIKKGAGDPGPTGFGRACGSALHETRFTRQRSHMPVGTIDPSKKHHKNDEGGAASFKEMSYVPKRNRILCSGPLVPPGVNMDDMLKEHERQIQEAVRKARIDKARSMQDF